MGRGLVGIALFAAIIAIGHLSVAADSSPANETCKAGDKQCAAPSEKVLRETLGVSRRGAVLTFILAE